MSRACCHHYPGGIAGCVSRSLHRRRRPSPLEWRVGSHIDCFEACSMFTRVAARTDRLPPAGPFLEVLQAIRRLLTRPEYFRLEREFAGPDFHRGEQCTFSRHTSQGSRYQQFLRWRDFALRHLFQGYQTGRGHRCRARASPKPPPQDWPSLVCPSDRPRSAGTPSRSLADRRSFVLSTVTTNRASAKSIRRTM